MIGLADLARAWSSVTPVGLDDAGRPSPVVTLLDLTALVDAAGLASAVAALAARRRVVIGVGGSPATRAAVAPVVDVCLVREAESPWDVAVADPVAAASDLERTAGVTPVAVTTLSWVLRAVEALPVLDGLAVESASYSTLLAGAEFRAWLSARGPAKPSDGPARVRVSRTDDRLEVVLDRPGRRNAVDRLMRDALVDALAVADADPSLSVEVSGAGACFSAGGDLDEFGSVDDVARAHVVRVAAGAAAALHRLAARTTVRVHGRNFGAGVELPTFAHRVVAAPDTTFVLPEIAMGLVPGAGGTVGLTHRIGRWRTFWLALSGHELRMPEALEWGLVDAVD